jgi:propanol-preferring alcohol dehydrogenase
MRAFRVLGKGQVALQEVPVPVPGPGEVRVRVAANGMCHSDVGSVEQADAGWALVPRALGHETTGWIDEIGPSVQGLEVGTVVGVYSLISCNSCPECLAGRVNRCRRRFPPALGFTTDGGLADYMVVPADNAVPLGDVDPVQAAPLMDAGLTAYHASRLVRERLAPGSRCVIIGIGGLGHLAVQIVKAISAAEVIAVDVDQSKLELAASLGADRTVLIADAAAPIRDWCDGLGADAVLDFVGADDSLALAAAVLAVGGRLVVAGMAAGTLPVVASPAQQLPHEAEVSVAVYGGRQDLQEVSALMAAGRISVVSTTYRLDDAMTAWDELVAGRVQGRAIVVP